MVVGRYHFVLGTREVEKGGESSVGNTDFLLESVFRVCMTKQ